MCDVNKRRFQCTCPPGYTGHRCQVVLPPRSCKDVMIFKRVTTNGIYNVTDQQNISFPVYCDFTSEPGAAWTLIQSHRDYWRVTLKSLDLLAASQSSAMCLSSEFVNVHGNECSNCTVWMAYDAARALHLDSSFGPSQGCDLGGGIFNEVNFGVYATTNSAFRCTFRTSSTTQFWIGSF